jgi:hypothetical protein
MDKLNLSSRGGAKETQNLITVLRIVLKFGAGEGWNRSVGPIV